MKQLTLNCQVNIKYVKALKWFNSLGTTQRNEYSFDYYGTDILTNEDILAIYTAEYRYYIEFDKKKFLCLFPFGEKEKEKTFKTLEEALNYMIDENKITEVTIKN